MPGGTANDTSRVKEGSDLLTRTSAPSGAGICSLVAGIAVLVRLDGKTLTSTLHLPSRSAIRSGADG